MKSYRSLVFIKIWQQYSFWQPQNNFLKSYIQFAFRSIAFVFEFVVADGPAGGFNDSSIHGNAFVDSQTLGFELAQDFGGLPC